VSIEDELYDYVQFFGADIKREIHLWPKEMISKQYYISKGNYRA
jgi:hypothetical protein